MCFGTIVFQGRTAIKNYGTRCNKQNQEEFKDQSWMKTEPCKAIEQTLKSTMFVVSLLQSNNMIDKNLVTQDNCLGYSMTACDSTVKSLAFCPW